jgi:hypothetical protein
MSFIPPTGSIPMSFRAFDYPPSVSGFDLVWSRIESAQS